MRWWCCAVFSHRDKLAMRAGFGFRSHSLLPVGRANNNRVSFECRILTENGLSGTLPESLTTLGELQHLQVRSCPS